MLTNFTQVDGASLWLNTADIAIIRADLSNLATRCYLVVSGYETPFYVLGADVVLYNQLLVLDGGWQQVLNADASGFVYVNVGQVVAVRADPDAPTTRTMLVMGAQQTPLEVTGDVATVAAALNAVNSGAPLKWRVWTPVGTKVANLDTLSMKVAFAMLIGKAAHVWGAFTYDATAASNVALFLSLPWASNFAAQTDLYGIGIGQSGTGFVIADVANDVAALTLGNTSTVVSLASYGYGYQILT